MARMLDFDEKEPQWLEGIEKQKQIIIQSDKITLEQEEKKKIAKEEIDRLNRFLQTAQEMLPPHLKKKSKTAESKVVSSNGSVKGLKLIEAIKKILRSDPEKSFEGKEVKDLLLERGFKSKSPHFRTMIDNTLRRLVKKGDITVDDRGFKNLYKHKEKEENESLLK